MILGTSTAQARQTDRTAHIWWAWHPVRLQDGRIAWLCPVCRWWAEDRRFGSQTESRQTESRQTDGRGGWCFAALEAPARQTRQPMAALR